MVIFISKTENENIDAETDDESVDMSTLCIPKSYKSEMTDIKLIKQEPFYGVLRRLLDTYYKSDDYKDFLKKKSEMNNNGNP